MTGSTIGWIALAVIVGGPALAFMIGMTWCALKEGYVSPFERFGTWRRKRRERKKGVCQYPGRLQDRIYYGYTEGQWTSVLAVGAFNRRSEKEGTGGTMCAQACVKLGDQFYEGLAIIGDTAVVIASLEVYGRVVSVGDGEVVARDGAGFTGRMKTSDFDFSEKYAEIDRWCRSNGYPVPKHYTFLAVMDRRVTRLANREVKNSPVVSDLDGLYDAVTEAIAREGGSAYRVQGSYSRSAGLVRSVMGRDDMLRYNREEGKCLKTEDRD